jgi:eukaryotic-like serine/threonine-protein kinase
MTSHDLPAGTATLHADDPLQIGRFRLLGRLGHGGMGVVYLAADHNGAPAAVKVLHPHLPVDVGTGRGLRREAELIGLIVSPRIPRLIEHGEADGRAYLAMQCLPGVTLTYQVACRGVLRGAELIALAAGVAAALTDIHRAGVMHLDVKPSNVLLSSHGIYLLDFGIAETTTETSPVPTARTGLIIGSPAWMAPEHFTGAPVTTATDVFAWASLVAYAATGRFPFGSSDIAAVVARIIHAKPDHRHLPALLRNLVRAAFAKTPHHRPTAAHLHSALITDRSTPPKPQRPRWYRHAQIAKSQRTLIP